MKYNFFSLLRNICIYFYTFLQYGKSVICFNAQDKIINTDIHINNQIYQLVSMH